MKRYQMFARFYNQPNYDAKSIARAFAAEVKSTERFKVLRVRFVPVSNSVNILHNGGIEARFYFDSEERRRIVSEDKEFRNLYIKYLPPGGEAVFRKPGDICYSLR